MKALIIYATKGGVSRRCCEILAERLERSMEVTMLDINDVPPSPEGFDVAVIGGSVRIGRINKKLKAKTLNGIKLLYVLSLS